MNDSMRSYLKNAFVGAFVGIAAIIPGVSGGLIAVLCGVYERLIEDLSDLRHKLFSDFRFILTFGIGLIIGVLSIAFILDYTLDAFKVACMAFFFGLILAQIPDVYGMNDYDKNKMPEKSGIAAFLVGLGLIIILVVINAFSEGGVNPQDHTLVNMMIFLACGIIVAISMIMPGISGATLLIALGLFDISISSIVHLDVFFLVPLGIGLVIGILGFANVINYALHHYNNQTYMMILGLTVGSLIILVQEICSMNPDLVGIIIAVVMGAIGVAISYGFSYLGKKMNY